MNKIKLEEVRKLIENYYYSQRLDLTLRKCPQSQSDIQEQEKDKLREESYARSVAALSHILMTDKVIITPF